MDAFRKSVSDRPLMLTSQQKLAPAELLVNDEERLRVRRTWLMLDVVFLTWAFFCVFVWFRGYDATTAICQTQIVCYLVINVLMRNKARFTKLFNLYMACIGTGIFFSAVSDPNMWPVIFFFPISIMLSAYLFGIRVATWWLGASILNFVAFFIYLHGIADTFTVQLDQLICSIGTAFCAFFCCQQADATYKSQTRGLIKFSNALRERSKELERLATTDSLTNLTNRFQFQNELEEMVRHATPKSKVALFLIDMDGFKEINDTLGHSTGDEVLVEIGKRLAAALKHRASVARLGGDEFCVLFEGVEGVEEADEIGSELFELLTARYVLSDIKVTLGTSVGYALCPDHAESGQSILSYADTAMYHAKHNKKNVSIYKSEMTELIAANRVMNEHLAVALERDEFFLLYQPQVDLSGDVIGAEALMRWRHQGKTISPIRFISLLENTGRIIPVSKWLIREACRQQAEWKKQGLDISIAVNISAIQFIDDDFVNSVIRPIKEFGISPDKLEIEITEGILIDNVEQVIEKLKQVKGFGVPISIDDFGTGYSSLAYLRQFPLDKLKIDRAFVKDIPDTDDGVIASGIITLASMLNLEVIAEGVETPEQIQFLDRNGCTQFQGFYFSPPVEPNEFLAYAHLDKQPSLIPRPEVAGEIVD